MVAVSIVVQARAAVAASPRFTTDSRCAIYRPEAMITAAPTQVHMSGKLSQTK